MTEYETDWYHLPDVPEFLVCTRCHSRFISGTKLAPSFEKSRRPSGKCRFNNTRVIDVLVPQFHSNGDIQPLKSYMTKRLAIKDCDDKGGIKSSDGFKWYKIGRETNSVMVNFIACEACYHEYIAPSRYEGEFVDRLEAQPENSTWRCDMSFDYILRSFLVHSRANTSFMEWVDLATHRFQVPACEDRAFEGSNRNWVRPRQLVEGLVLCEQCYLDKVALTHIDKEFEYLPKEWSKTGSEWMDLALGYRTAPATSYTW